MELSELAKQVLFSERLSDKLFSPPSLEDLRPRAGARPDLPARPRGLRFDDGRPRAHFPKPSELHSAEARGRALHFFASHELLAIELMGVCLLAFPGAPEGFRRGVAHTLLEEQRHLGRYLGRMAELGVRFGDYPVSAHFWRVLAPMASPSAYAAGMGLVFEQANLDHAAAWMRRFRAVEDHDSARLLEEVLEDEIGHVAHGATWLRRFHPNADLFDAFEAALPGGLDPVRARGPEIELEPRRRAGLDSGFIERLRQHRGSKGRRPRAWIFWPDVEEHCAGRTEPSKPVARLSEALAPAFAFLGADDDVALGSAPAPELVAAWSAVGLATPAWVETVADLAERNPDGLHPWGWSPEVRRRLRPAQARTRVPPPEGEDGARLDKALALPVRRAWAEEGRLPRSLVGAELERIEALSAFEGGPFVIKARRSASGRHRWVGTLPLEDPRARARVAGLLERGAVIEPWRDRVADFGLVGVGSAKPTLLRFLTDARGAYRGHVLAPPSRAAPPEVVSTLARADPDGLGGLVRSMASSTLEALERTGASELPWGVDMMVYRDAEGLALQPWVEINARYTMGHVAAALQRRMAPGSVGVWVHLRPAAGLEAAATGWLASERSLDARGRLRAGVLPTTDPRHAGVTCCVWSVDRTLSAALDRLGPWAPALD